MTTFVFDCETLPNYSVVGFKDVRSGEVTQIRRHEPDAPLRLRQFMNQPGATFIGFNNHNFDDVIAAAFMLGYDEPRLKSLADELIVGGVRPWEAARQHRLPRTRFDSIDLIEVAPSFVGLKAYGARMGMRLLQDMPIAHDAVITDDQRAIVDSYNVNDLDTTEALLKRLEGQLSLRVELSRQYGVDLRSKSDSQMAEQAFITALGLERKANVIPATIAYRPPAFLDFADRAMQELLERTAAHTFVVNQQTGHVVLPDFLGADVIEFCGGTYQLGVGGIHSTHDKSICYVAHDELVIDADVTSYYPSIILNSGLVPEGLGAAFLDEYRDIYTRRIAAKRAGNRVEMDSLRIALNGTFGKLASKWSVLYAPDLMLTVTLTGQFTLLMLIERLTAAGARILSANTDGIGIGCKAADRAVVEQVVAEFTQLSGYNFEFTDYRVLAMKDVNNYFAVKTDRSLKAKGIYAPLSLSKNPTAQVAADAVAQWLAHGTPFMETIRAAGLQSFLSARNVTGGGEQGGEYLGRVVRWYMSTDKELPPIRYVKNGNKVPKTEGARAAMLIEDFESLPSDLDYAWYYKEACKIARDCGCIDYLTDDERNLITKTKGKRK